ncbi:uncharacterized protein LOC133780490 [Humulus lupulus]|uniref:uncharacterized protein LOC133780490 n=1 Tax=Humulus lupulus TaxID=3486 RepID=UPI002B401094|nr:uncharacterized protein LOC133780490 [Humulus lupulus]
MLNPRETHPDEKKKKEEDEEIGVFRVKKCFNGVIDDDDTSSRVSSISMQEAITTLTRMMNGMEFLSSLGCKCSCSDKNSVDTKDVGEINFS